MALFDSLKNREHSEIEVLNRLISDGELLLDSNDIASEILSFGTSIKKNTTELMKSGVGWSYACIDAIANEIGNIELKLMQIKGRENVDEITEHDILDLLHRANNNTTKYDLFYLSQQYLELVGEAPWLLQFQGGKPVNIFLLRPDRLKVLPPRADDEIIGGYKYQVFDEKGGFKEVFLEPFEVVFLKYPDPNSNFRGRGTLQAVLRTYDIDETAERYNLKFFQNAASPHGVVSTDRKLSQEQKEFVKKQFKEKYEGWTNAHKTLVLEHGLKYEKMALSQKEMDFIETMKFTRDKILAIFRVPKTVLGLTEDVNRANAEASDFVFAKRTIKPKMQKLVEMLNEFLVPMFDNTGNLFLDYVDPVPENIELKIKQAQVGLQAGYLTINEAREINGYDSIEGGDELKSPSSFELPEGTGISMPNTIKAKPQKRYINSGLFRSGNSKRRERIKKTMLKKEVENTVNNVVSDIVESSLFEKHKELKKAKSKRIFSDDKEQARRQKEDFVKRQLRTGEEFEPEYGRAIASVFRSQKNKTLDKMRGRQVNDFLLNEGEEIQVTINKMKPVTLTIITKQSKTAFQLLGIDDKLTQRIPTVKDYLEKRVFQFSEEITKETNKRLGKLLSDSIANGDSEAVRISKVSEFFEGMEKFRSQRIARSEIVRATSFANEEAYIQSGVVEAKEWITLIDENTDDECLSMNGKVIKLGRTFFNKGDNIGKLSLDYEDISGPPLHVNCRCDLVPVVIP